MTIDYVPEADKKTNRFLQWLVSLALKGSNTKVTYAAIWHDGRSYVLACMFDYNRYGERRDWPLGTLKQIASIPGKLCALRNVTQGVANFNCKAKPVESLAEKAARIEREWKARFKELEN